MNAPYQSGVQGASTHLIEMRSKNLQNEINSQAKKTCNIKVEEISNFFGEGIPQTVAQLFSIKVDETNQDLKTTLRTTNLKSGGAVESMREFLIKHFSGTNS